METSSTWQESLGRPVEATDQPPGFYKTRLVRGGPWVPVRLMWIEPYWFCSVNLVEKGLAKDPADIPFVRDRGPFHPITEADYITLREAYRNAKPGTPLASPDQPVDLRGSEPL